MDRNYKIIFNITTGLVTIPKEIVTFVTDKNIFKLNMELNKIEKDKNIVIKNKELKNYKIELFATKPNGKEWVSCLGELDEKLDLINFDLEDNFSNVFGQYKCEVRITDNENKTFTSYPFVYNVKGSVTAKAIKEEKQIINKIEPKVIDNLITTNSNVSLSAKQGYLLNKRINDLEKEFIKRINNITTNLK